MADGSLTIVDAFLMHVIVWSGPPENDDGELDASADRLERFLLTSVDDALVNSVAFLAILHSSSSAGSCLLCMSAIAPTPLPAGTFPQTLS